jgi:hypothetical protein
MRTRRRNFDFYVAAQPRANAWAEKAILYCSAAQFARAGAAVERVQSWLSKVAVQEAQSAAVMCDIAGVKGACKE